MPRYSGISGNEKPDKCARHGSLTPHIGLEPALGTPKSLIWYQIMHWVSKNDKEEIENTPGNKHGNIFIKGPFGTRTEEHLHQNINWIRIFTRLLRVQLPEPIMSV